MKIVAELIVFLVKEERVAPAGERGSPTPCFVWSVERSWQLTLVNLAKMLTPEEEHSEKYNAKDEDNSVLWLHSLHHHQGKEDVPFSMKVTGGYPEPLDRQTMERVQISTFKGPVLMNRRNEMGGVRVERMQYRRWGGNS